MKRISILFPLLLTAVACGEVASTPGEITTGHPGSTPSSTLSPLSYGSVYALQTNTITMNGQNGYELGAALTAAAPLVDRCAGATTTSGACCFIPAPAAIDGGPATGLAGQNPDGGYSYVGENAGTIAFIDKSSNSPLSTASYGDLPTGFGLGEGYATSLIDPQTWSDGDVIDVSATGANGQITAFSSSIHAVRMPDTQMPAAIARATPLSFSWTPDSNAGSMTITLTAAANNVEHGVVSCQVDDKTGSVTIDASLTEDFVSGDFCWTDVEREADQNVEVTGGHVTFAARALNEVIVPVK